MTPVVKGDELIDAEIISMPERLVQHPLALATGGGSFLTSTGLAIAQTATDAAGSIPAPSLTGGAWLAAATAGLAFAGQAYMQWRSLRRQQDAADKAAEMDLESREHETWGGKYESELDRRVQAEARLAVMDERLRLLVNDLAKRDAMIADLKASVEHMNANVKHTAGLNAEIGKHNAETLDEVKADAKKIKRAVTKLSGSDINLDATTPDPKS